MIDTGDRIYATEEMIFGEYAQVGVIAAGTEGTVSEIRRDAECCELTVEWDSGYLAAADSGSVALVPTLPRPGERVQPGNLYACKFHQRGHWSAQAAVSCNRTMKSVTS